MQQPRFSSATQTIKTHFWSCFSTLRCSSAGTTGRRTNWPNDKKSIKSTRPSSIHDAFTDRSIALPSWSQCWRPWGISERESALKESQSYSSILENSSSICWIRWPSRWNSQSIPNTSKWEGFHLLSFLLLCCHRSLCTGKNYGRASLRRGKSARKS